MSASCKLTFLQMSHKKWQALPRQGPSQNAPCFSLTFFLLVLLFSQLPLTPTDRITEGVWAPGWYSGFWGPAGIANLGTKLASLVVSQRNLLKPRCGEFERFDGLALSMPRLLSHPLLGCAATRAPGPHVCPLLSAGLCPPGRMPCSFSALPSHSICPKHPPAADLAQCHLPWGLFPSLTTLSASCASLPPNLVLPPLAATVGSSQVSVLPPGRTSWVILVKSFNFLRYSFLCCRTQKYYLSQRVVQK